MNDFFDDITYTEQDTSRLVPMGELPCIPSDDKEAVSVIEPDIYCGPWIAGGACIKWYNLQAVEHADIDIFCKNQAQADEVVARIKGYNRFEVACQTTNATTLKYFSVTDPTKYWVLQVITVNFYEKIDDIIATFDISVCQIATAGTEWILGKYTAKDLKYMVLRFIDNGRAPSLKRLIKYWSYGYIPAKGVIESMQQSPNTVWSFENDVPYENF